MKDWQEIIKLYERENIYLSETAQIYVRNVNYEIPGVKKQMAKLEQQGDESIKRVQDLGKPEAQLLNEHSALLQQLNVKGENLREEFIGVLAKLPEIYNNSIRNISYIQEGIELYGEFSSNKICLPILRHVVEFGNTTVYQYIHKEAPLAIEENPIKLNLSEENAPTTNDVATGLGENEIDFGGDDNGGTSSTISAEIIDFGDFNLEVAGNEDVTAGGGDIDWGIESTPTDAVEINFDIPIEEYGIVVESVGMDGGTAKGKKGF